MKRRAPKVPPYALAIGVAYTKAQLLEALVDLWLQFNGHDVHPDDVSDEEWSKLFTEVGNRSRAVRRQMEGP